MKKIRILVSNLTEKTVSFFAKAKKRIAAHVRGFLAHTKAAVSAGASALGTLKKKSGRKKHVYMPRASSCRRKGKRRFKRNGIIGTVLERVTPRVLISVCVAIALIVTVSVFAFGKRNGQNDKMALAAGVSATSTSDPASTPSPTTAPPLDPATTTIKQGMSDPVVITIQQRLMDLNYMDDMEPTQLYGPLTKQAVELFQRQEGIAVDGCIGASTYSMLMAQNAPKYTVSEGAQGTDVKELETRLYELGYLDAASDKFTADTKTAVQKFQQLNGLAADGAIGENTMEMLYSDDVKPNIYMNGDQSQKILGYQKRLQSLGYLTTAPDGTYGTDTVNAIKRFQDQNGLIVDGYLGPQTISVLNSKDAQSNALTLGMSGNDVTRVQQKLITLKYMSSATGYYGSGTVNAVTAFQKQNGLKQDGKVGQQTLNTLMSTKAKAAPAQTSGSTKKNTTTGKSPSKTPSAPANTSGVEKLIAVAQTKLGCSYVRGAKGPNSFDCSGFVYWCLNQAGVVQSYMTSAGWQKCTKYERIEGMNNLQRGDVISFKGHVGIYMGGGEMINALDGIQISKNIQSSPYWTSHFVCGFRIF